MKLKPKKTTTGTPPEVLPTIPDADWNDEIAQDLKPQDLSSLVVYSRDWTIETINNQITQKNIDLNPQFQRRNAWNDDRRSKLIESLIAGLPVPEIVLAENPEKPKAFLVIDGKQRLLTIAGFIDPTIGYWKKSELKPLTLRPDLVGKTYDQIKNDANYGDDYRRFLKADIRCTVIGNVKNKDVLYDIFYRLNTGSVPLSTQELRQVLHKGPFADFLIRSTNSVQPLHKVLGLSEPDARLRDAEILLRFISLLLFGDKYKGNLKVFLDDAMEMATDDWGKYEPLVTAVSDKLNHAIEALNEAFGYHLIGRKYVGGQWEGRFNRVLFEVEAFYFRLLPPAKVKAGKQKFIARFCKLCDENSEFRSSIEATTKTNERYETRFRLFRDLVNESFGTSIKEIPVKA
jgi:hypothetical protein